MNDSKQQDLHLVEGLLEQMSLKKPSRDVDERVQTVLRSENQLKPNRVGNVSPQRSFVSTMAASLAFTLLGCAIGYYAGSAKASQAEERSVVSQPPLGTNVVFDNSLPKVAPPPLAIFCGLDEDETNPKPASDSSSCRDCHVATQDELDKMKSPHQVISEVDRLHRDLCVKCHVSVPDKWWHPMLHTEQPGDSWHELKVQKAEG